MDNIVYTNEMPTNKAHITLYPAISSCSPELIANANATGVLPTPDLHYFEISWRRAVGGKAVKYIHRFAFPTYAEAVDAYEKLDKKLHLDSDDYIDPEYAMRIANTEKLLKPVRFNRAKAKEWADLLRVPLEVEE